jgi:FixJ family two-component response regulator
MPSNTAVMIELGVEERAQMEAWSRRRTSAQALAQRSRIVLLAAEGLTNLQIAEQLGVHRTMVTRWRIGLPSTDWTAWSMSRGPGGPGR